MRDAPVHVLGVTLSRSLRDSFLDRQPDACPFLLLRSLQLAGAVLHSALLVLPTRMLSFAAHDLHLGHVTGTWQA